MLQMQRKINLLDIKASIHPSDIVQTFSVPSFAAYKVEPLIDLQMCTQVYGTSRGRTTAACCLRMQERIDLRLISVHAYYRQRRAKVSVSPDEMKV